MAKVIAIGNRLMKDDGIALNVAEAAKNRLEAMGLDVLIGETDFEYCFHQLNSEDIIIILDASNTGADAGSIRLINLEEAATVYGEMNSQHDMNVFDLMRLYSKPLKGYLIGIEAAEVGFGWGISETLKIKFDAICNKIEEIIIEIIKEA